MQCQCESNDDFIYCSRDNCIKDKYSVSICRNMRTNTEKSISHQQDIPIDTSLYPSLLEQASNLAKATTVHILDGMTEVDNTEASRRIQICESCPLFTASERRCRLCGCYMDVKTRWRTGSCPDNPPRW